MSVFYTIVFEPEKADRWMSYEDNKDFAVSKSRQYENDIRQGKVLFSMKTDEDKVDMVSSVLRNNGASNVNVH